MDLTEAFAQAEAATAAYIGGDRNAKPREALSRWEEMVRTAIATEQGDRTCSICKVERVSIIINRDGTVVCGRCARGLTSG